MVGALARAFRTRGVCQCAGLDSRGFNTRYRGDCCSALDLLNATQRPTKLPPRSTATVRGTAVSLGPLPPARTRPGKQLLGTYTRQGHFRPSNEERERDAGLDGPRISIVFLVRRKSSCLDNDTTGRVMIAWLTLDDLGNFVDRVLSSTIGRCTDLLSSRS